LAVGIEDLDPVVLAIADVDAPPGVEDDRVRQVEFPGPSPLLAPLLEQLAVRGELEHAGIAVAVRDVELATRGNGDVGGPVKLVAADARLPLLAQGQE